MLTEDKLNLNFVNFISKLEKYDVYPELMADDEEFNRLLRKASAFTGEDSGGAYEGSLVEHITRIAVIAFNINKVLQEEIRVPVDALIRVAYLHQISKALMITNNTVEWEVKKGKMFTFNRNIPAIKTGEYSLYLCSKYGIQLTEDEYEAILSVDKDDDQTKYFSSALSQVLRTSVDMANAERRLQHKLSKK
jgi:hypothetical protein